MDEGGFESAVDALHHRLPGRLERADTDLEVGLERGVLTIELAWRQNYVNGKDAPNREMWMASPVSGASHFPCGPAAGRWVCKPGGEALIDLLARELEAAAGAEFDLG
ncbi:MAG: iron donor protein CyaY [Alphaproteobacteria bacterium]